MAVSPLSARGQDSVTVRRGDFALVHPQHWTTGKAHTASAKWDVRFFAVANEAGLKRNYREYMYSLELGYNRVKRPDVHRQTKTAYPMQGLHAPSRFAKTQNAAPRHWREQTLDKEASLPAEMQSLVELKHVAEDIIYTDGSRREFPNAGIVRRGGVHRKSAHAPIQLAVRTNTAGENTLSTELRPHQFT